MADGSQTGATALKPYTEIPLIKGLPWIGTSLDFLRDQRGATRKAFERHGPIYRNRALFREQLVLLGPEANEFVFMDRGRALSSRLGWGAYLDRLFPRSLMLMDFDEHRAHRKIMSQPFKTGPMRAYADRLNAVFAPVLADWTGSGTFRFYPAVKRLTLNLAADIFLGLSPGPETDKVNRALSAIVQSSVALLRAPVPGSAWKRGLDGRRFMVDFLMREVPRRRGASGEDMFTLMCNAADEDGRAFSDQEVVDHLIFLWMAGHDTITSSLTTLVYELARARDWQERLAGEVAALNLAGGPLPYERLGDMPLAEAAFKEALRLVPPVPSLPRRSLRPLSFAGYSIPAETEIAVVPNFVHVMDAVWPNPERFDPTRFTEDGGVRARHKFAWVPFGGGAHMCLGLHFAYMAAKIFLAQALPRCRFALRPDYRIRYQQVPIPKPKDGLPIRLDPVA